MDSFLIRFIAHTSTKISDKYEGLTEGRKSAIRWDLGEDFAGDSISILRGVAFQGRQEDEGSGRLAAKFDPA